MASKSRRGLLLLDYLEPKCSRRPTAELKTLGTITCMEVQSLLVFSHAYVIDMVPANRRGVTILPARMLAWYFSRQRPTMSVEQADAIYDRLCLAVGQPPSP